MAFSSFEELAKSRSDWYEISKKNDFDKGIERLLTKLYPDKAHFIFELLQNAEDALATRVEFRLESDALIFIHNGKRLFNLRDVESITSIADSTKRDDGTAIGKFGIGFKAVFAYTETPVIHSGEWHFSISHMVVPSYQRDVSDYQSLVKDETLFKFPFNKKTKEPRKAYAEILAGLKDLAPETILFLRNISKVYISYEGKEQSIIKTQKDQFVELTKVTSVGVRKTSKYLVFSKIVEGMELEDGSKIGQMSVGVGYRLERKDKVKPNKGLNDCLSDIYEIVPVEKRNVYVFFPAEKESSGLRLCIHAPFASTAARDSICDTADNRNLMAYVSELQIESLAYLREEGFLTTEFLEVLPNSRDCIGDMYQCFWQNLVSAFNKDCFVPKKYGGFAPAKHLYRGSAAISDIISDADLSDLTWCEPISWMKNPSQNHSNADRFLRDLHIEEWGVEDLLDVLTRFKHGWDEDEHEEAVRQVFVNKNNAQLYALYALLEDYIFNGYYDCDSYEDDLKDAPIFRIVDGSMAAASEGIVIGTANSINNNIQSVKLLHSELTAKDRSKKQWEMVNNFLRRMGIEPFSDSTMLKMFIDHWKNRESKITVEQSVKNLKILISLVTKNEISSEIAKDFPVLNSDGEYVKISNTIIDEPYEKTGLSCYASLLGKQRVFLLNEIYARLLDKEALECLVGRNSFFGIKKKLWLIDSPIYDNPRRRELWDFTRRTSSYERAEDYDIPGIDDFVRSPTSEQAKLIWEFVLAGTDGKQRALYRANSSDPGRSVPARYLQILERSNWIPVVGQDRMLKPTEVSFDSLPIDWTRPNAGYEYGALKLMNFGRNTKIKMEEEKQRDIFLKKNGFAGAKEVDELREIKKLCKEQRIQLEQVLKQIKGENNSDKKIKQEQKEYPKRSTSNVSDRIARASKEFRLAKEQEYVVVGRSVHIANFKVRDAARTYLRGEYEIDGAMFCQMCHKSVPFVGRDGRGYFSAIQVFTRMHKDIATQFISLCPICSAKYDEWVRRLPDRIKEFKEKIISRRPKQGEEFVKITLPGKSENGVKSPLAGKEMYFTGTHFVDLRQAVIENESSGSVDHLIGDVDEGGNKKSFVEWLRGYDTTVEHILDKVTEAYKNLDQCRIKGKIPGIVMWSTSAKGYVDRVMSFWKDYHAECPSGESEPEARVSVEHYCQKRKK